MNNFKTAALVIAIGMFMAIIGIIAKAMNREQVPRKKEIWVHVGQRRPNHLKHVAIINGRGCIVYESTTPDSINYWVECNPLSIVSFEIPSDY